MPTKHIDNESWDLVERTQVKATKELSEPVKESDVLSLLLHKGAGAVTSQDLRGLSRRRTFVKVLCLESDYKLHQVKNPTSPEPEGCAALIRSLPPALLIVYGTPGDGVTTFVNSVKEHYGDGLGVYHNDEREQLDEALAHLRQGQPAVVGMYATSYEHAIQTLLTLAYKNVGSAAS